MNKQLVIVIITAIMLIGGGIYVWQNPPFEGYEDHTNNLGTILLEQMVTYAEIEGDKQVLREVIQSYYDHFFDDHYPSYQIFINDIIMAPDTVPEKNYRLLGNPDGLNYGPYFLRYFVISAYYEDKILFNETQKYIDNVLVNDNETIKYGGRTTDGKFVLAGLPKTVGELIANLQVSLP